MKKFLLLTVLAALGLALAPAADAASGHRVGDVVGVVLDTAGMPVADAEVGIEVHTPNGHVFRARMRSDARGHFAFRRVPVGHGEVRAHKPGVGRGRVRGRVLAGQTVRARIVLH